MSEPVAIEVQSWRAALEQGSFEDATAALESVVACLERGQLRLEDALAVYELGVQLADRCDADLAHAELRVSRLSMAPAAPDPWNESIER